MILPLAKDPKRRSDIDEPARTLAMPRRPTSQACASTNCWAIHWLGYRNLRTNVSPSQPPTGKRSTESRSRDRRLRDGADRPTTIGGRRRAFSGFSAVKSATTPPGDEHFGQVADRPVMHHRHRPRVLFAHGQGIAVVVLALGTDRRGVPGQRPRLPRSRRGEPRQIEPAVSGRQSTAELLLIRQRVALRWTHRRRGQFDGLGHGGRPVAAVAGANDDRVEPSGGLVFDLQQCQAALSSNGPQPRHQCRSVVLGQFPEYPGQYPSSSARRRPAAGRRWVR